MKKPVALIGLEPILPSLFRLSFKGVVLFCYQLGKLTSSNKEGYSIVGFVHRISLFQASIGRIVPIGIFPNPECISIRDLKYFIRIVLSYTDSIELT